MLIFNVIVTGVLLFICWELYSINKHLDIAMPGIIDRLTYLEHRQAPHTFNNTKPTKPGL